MLKKVTIDGWTLMYGMRSVLVYHAACGRRTDETYIGTALNSGHSTIEDPGRECECCGAVPPKHIVFLAKTSILE